jgi:hypothetical protein
MNRVQVDLNVITGCYRVESGEKGELTFFTSLHDSAAHLEPHPNANCPKLSRFHFLAECCIPAFNYMKPILAFNGETI